MRKYRVAAQGKGPYGADARGDRAGEAATDRWHERRDESIHRSVARILLTPSQSVQLLPHLYERRFLSG